MARRSPQLSSVGALCLLALGAVVAEGAGEADSADTESLIQTVLRHETDFRLGRSGLLDSSPLARINCTAHPSFCEAPFNCQSAQPVIPHAQAGHSNFGTWCRLPQYYPYLDACVVQRDLRKAAQIQYQWSLDQKNGVDELDGSYCFMEGHCSNTAVTENTTVEEAEAMCDKRYGHDGWAKWSPLQATPGILSLVFGKLFGEDMASPTTGFHDPAITRIFLKLACVLGNYHCDVMYCKETYCKNDYYIRKYKHLEPPVPGHLLDQRLGPR